MKSAKKIIAIAIVAIILVGGGFVFGVKKASLKKAEITSDIIEERLVEAKELTSLKYKYTNVASFEDQDEFYGMKVPFTKKKFIISYDGDVMAGVDLDKAEIKVNQGKITIKLPEAKILAHQIDENSLKIFDEKNSIFNQLEVKDFSDFRKDQKIKVENDLIAKGFLKEAQKNAQKVIKELLEINPEIKENYTIDFK